MQNTSTIYNQYSKKIYNLAYRMTGNKDDANDITQETFLQAFNALDQFNGESQLYTWLYQIAKNNCLQFIGKKNKTTFLSLHELVEKASSPVSEEISETEKSQYIAQVKDGCLSGLLRCLSLQQRLAFILNVLLDLPIEQVSTVIGKSENATRILVHRSRQNIRKYLCCNCSLYDSNNPCHCENLINFSLKQGWINSEPVINGDLNRIETDIRNLKSVVDLYKTLHEETMSDAFSNQIRQLLANNEDLSIFVDKKVK